MSIIINFRKVLLITAIPFFIAASCNKDKTEPCRGGDIYNFSVTSEFYPQKEIYNIGDTIYLNSMFSKSLLDNISNQNIDYSNSVNIGGNIKGIYMDTISRAINDSLNAFELVNIVGSYTFISNTQNKGINIFYFENPSNYSIKFGFKCKQRGLFYLGMTDLGSKGIVGKNCTNAGFGMTVINTNKNLNLFQYALGYTPDALLQKSIYCFRVQ